jgi:hypothetical protein
MRGLTQNVHCHTIISYTQTAQRWTKNLAVPGSFFEKKIKFPTFSKPSDFHLIQVSSDQNQLRYWKHPPLHQKTSRLNNNFHRQQIKFGSIGKCLLDQPRNCTALHYLTGKSENDYSKDSGIPGNDIVDLVAKWSAASPVLPIVTPPKTAESFIQDVVQQIAKNWKLKFENAAPSPRPSHRYVTTKLPTQFHIDRLYDSTRLPSQNTTLTHLRTNTFNLNYYLHKINRADTPKCQCGFNNEAIATKAAINSIRYVSI